VLVSASGLARQRRRDRERLRQLSLRIIVVSATTGD
jgi:hypothetical protein